MSLIINSDSDYSYFWYHYLNSQNYSTILRNSKDLIHSSFRKADATRRSKWSFFSLSAGVSSSNRSWSFLSSSAFRAARVIYRLVLKATRCSHLQWRIQWILMKLSLQLNEGSSICEVYFLLQFNFWAWMSLFEYHYFTKRFCKVWYLWLTFAFLERNITITAI